MLGFTVHSQTNGAFEKLKELGISEHLFLMNTWEAISDFAYETKTTINTSTEESIFSKTVEIARYNPSAPDGKEWVLVSVNDRSPDYLSQSEFDKAKKGSKEGRSAKIDPASWTLTEEDGYWIFGFKYMKSTLPKQSIILEDCYGKAYISKTDKHLNKIVFQSNEPLKMGGVKIISLKKEIAYQYLDNSCVIKDENVRVIQKYMGKESVSDLARVYTNYRKNK